MAGSGAGVTLLPTFALAVENQHGQLGVRRFKTPAPTRRLVLAWRKGSALARPLQAVAATLGKARRSLP
jgi:LysR family hydrogen peroxide-inducible transcriptional activator